MSFDTESMIAAFDRWVLEQHGAVVGSNRVGWVNLFAAGWRTGIVHNEAHHTRQDELFARAIASLVAEKDRLTTENERLSKAVEEARGMADTLATQVMQLKEALHKYGKHIGEGERWNFDEVEELGVCHKIVASADDRAPDDVACSCGFETACAPAKMEDERKAEGEEITRLRIALRHVLKWRPGDHSSPQEIADAALAAQAGR